MLTRFLELTMALKKGTRVKVSREKLMESTAVLANDPRWSPYLFETWGEVVELRGSAAQVVFGSVPTPPVWLPQELLLEGEA
jgi:hypothetical protein